MPPPRGIFNDTVAVLDAKVPVVLWPTALTDKPFAGFTVTVISVFNGRFAQFTTMGIGFACWPEMMASGETSWPLGVAETEAPATLAMNN